MMGCACENGLIDYTKFIELVDYRKSCDISKFDINKESIEHINTARNNYSTNYNIHDAHINKISTKVIYTQ